MSALSTDALTSQFAGGPPKPKAKREDLAMVPTTDFKVFARRWDAKITKIINSHGMGAYVDDIKQEIFLRMSYKKDGLNGLERYDPSRARFSTYCYTLILIVVRNYRSRVLRQRKWEISESAIYREDDPSNYQSIEVLAERGQVVAKEESSLKETDFKLQLAELREHLSRYEPRSVFFREGEVITRDLVTFFDLLLKDKSRKEIQDYLEYSTGSIGAMYEALRNVPQLKELLDRPVEE